MNENLQSIIVSYLEEKGWYFDWKKYKEHYGRKPSPQRLNKEIREVPCWTLPQWGEYWTEPFSDDPNHKNFGKPKTRRYENLKDALWLQVLRGEESKTYERFFKKTP